MKKFILYDKTTESQTGCVTVNVIDFDSARARLSESKNLQTR